MKSETELTIGVSPVSKDNVKNNAISQEKSEKSKLGIVLIVLALIIGVNIQLN